jgi:hypothetical protein
MTRSKMSNNLLLHLVLLSIAMRICWYTCAQCAHWHLLAGGRRIHWRRLCWQTLFVKGSKRRCHIFTEISQYQWANAITTLVATFSHYQAGPNTVATGADDLIEPVATHVHWHAAAGGKSSNGRIWLHRACCYACPLARYCGRKEDVVEKILLTIFFCDFNVPGFLPCKNYL